MKLLKNFDFEKGDPLECKLTTSELYCPMPAHLQSKRGFTLARFKEEINYTGSSGSGYGYSCTITENIVHCWGGSGTHFLVDYLKPSAVSTADDICILDREGLKCLYWYAGEYTKKGEILFDQSKYFYTEKAQTLEKLQKILAEADVSASDFSSMAYLREVVLQQYLQGMINDNVEQLRKNSKVFQNLFISNKLTSFEELSQRNDTQLRFVLSAISYSLTSSKIILSNNTKHVVDSLLLKLGRILSEETITLADAINFSNELMNQSSMLNELSDSHRLMGFKAYYQWAHNYLTTGRLN